MEVEKGEAHRVRDLARRQDEELVAHETGLG
jgi:hypothetical protein